MAAWCLRIGPGQLSTKAAAFSQPCRHSAHARDASLSTPSSQQLPFAWQPSMSARGKSANRAAAAWDVEQVTEAGTVGGWAYDPAVPGPASVSILFRGAVVAEAIACAFRADLLSAGHGHGHYGFAARLRAPLRPGTALLSLLLDGHSAGTPRQIAVPKQRQASPCTVEDLLASPASWTGADLLGRPDCLPWSLYLARLGAPRFIDAAYRFVLARWPSEAEISVHARGLQQGHATAEGLIVRLLRSRERADLPALLVPPFHPDFLFAPPVSFSGLLPPSR